jgi:endonuclease YncB( thermonuclease family)
VSVNYGASQPFAIIPDAGHYITDVFVDGVSNGTISSYTFSNVMANHTINASFAIYTYVITPTTPLVDGAINPNTPQTVNYGDTPTFTFTPSAGYHLDTVLVDGNPMPPTTPTTYTFPAVTANYTIAGTFAINAYTITSSAGPNGAISPSGPVNANDGDTPTFTITPNVGYHIADVLVDAGSVGAVPTYTFASVHADHTISATFAANAPVSLFYNDFESGFSNWTIAGDVSRQTGVVPKNATASIRLRNTGSMQQTISTLSHSSIGVSFAMAASSLDNAGERVYAEWYDGSTWTILKQITNGGGENDNTLRYYSYSLPAGADHNANFQLRFRITGNANDDIGYVDNVQITGIPD